MINKKIWLVVCILTPLFAELSIGQMETMVEKIKAKRIGTNIQKSDKFISPFVMIQMDENKTVLEKPKTDVVFSLGGIMNDKAFVNQKWVKVGDMIDGYKVAEMDDHSVTLLQDERTIKVFLKKSKTILQVNEG